MNWVRNSVFVDPGFAINTDNSFKSGLGFNKFIWWLLTI